MRLSPPRTVRAKETPFELSVGVEGVEPLSRVHPEKVLVRRFSELNHRLAPSDPLTTVYKVFCATAAAGVSMVVPVGRLCQLPQAPSDKVR
jgi:hypothetical protein